MDQESVSEGVVEVGRENRIVKSDRLPSQEGKSAARLDGKSVRPPPHGGELAARIGDEEIAEGEEDFFADRN